MKYTTLTTLLTFLAAVSAHPGEDHTHEAAERAVALSTMGKRSLSHCADKLAARGVHAQNQIRRRAFLDSVQAMRKRDITSVLATDHKSNLTGITAATSPDTVFSGQNQCILAPEVTQGPYYVTGEYFRQNITEGQAGVPLYLDIQVIDTNTCEPISNAALDLWHCNATGVYSGVVASGNGDSSDASNLNATFLRGIQSTDSDGVVQFRTIVPGHYSGRTNHIHVLAHTNWTLLANNTISGGEQGAHVGQIFVDQDLLTEVEATEPYASNTQAHTLNSEDNIMSQEAADFDPVFEYVLLGDSVNAGIFGWISIGVNASASYDVSPAVRYGADGGVVNENASLGGGPGGGPGGPGGNGTMPGGMGNGTMPGGMGNGTMPPGMPGGAAPSGTMMPGGASGTAAIPQDSAAPTDVAPTESASDAVTATASSPDSKHSHAQQSHNNESHTNQSPAEQSHGKGSHTKASHTKQFGAKPTGAKQNGTMESDHQQSDDQELEDSQCNNTRQRRRR